MLRDYETGITDQVKVFSGLEVEHTPAYGKQTLFLAKNDLTFDQIHEMAVKVDAEAVYYGANRTFMHNHGTQIAQMMKFLDKGYYVKPTVFADVNNKMEIAKTEIFGPVLSVIPFETEEEAISIANDTPYGLTNYIQTQDQKKANRVARKLRSGMVDVNGAGIAVDAPFGGFKHSGIGREAGAQGLEEFLEIKSVGGWE